MTAGGFELYSADQGSQTQMRRTIVGKDNGNKRRGKGKTVMGEGTGPSGYSYPQQTAAIQAFKPNIRDFLVFQIKLEFKIFR